jgi:hypothetical protein
MHLTARKGLARAFSVARSIFDRRATPTKRESFGRRDDSTQPQAANRFRHNADEISLSASFFPSGSLHVRLSSIQSDEK